MKWSIIILIGFLLTATVGGFFLMRSEQVLLFGNEGLEQEGITEEANLYQEDNVYINDSNVFINANPATITSDGYIYFNVTSKVYTGDIDIVFGFNTDVTKPKSIELYINKTYNETYSYTCEDSFNYTINPNYFWCYKTHVNNESQIITEMIFDHSFEEGDLPSSTASWNETKIQEWKDFSDTFQSIDYNYEGMNKWHFALNIPIVQDEEYYFRGKLNIIPSTEGSSGKYWFAIKPSGETLNQAISNGHFYALDPWWNSSWDYKKEVVLNSTVNSALTDFPAYFEIDTASLISAGKMNVSCKDIRVLNGSEDATLNYEIIACNTARTIVWVNIETFNPGNQSFYVYYGNPSASSTQNYRAVWINENIRNVYHANINATPVIDSRGTANGTFNLASGTANLVDAKFDKAINWTGGHALNRIEITSPGIFEDPFYISARATVEENVLGAVYSNYQASFSYGPTLYGAKACGSGTENFCFSYFDEVDAQYTIYPSTWNLTYGQEYYVGTMSNTSGSYLYVDGVLEGYNSQQNLASNLNGFEIANDFTIDRNLRGAVNEFRIYNNSVNADWITAEYNQQYSLGSEEGEAQLDIINPTTASPTSVSFGDNLSILFNYTFNGVNQTTEVTTEKVTIGGSNAPIWSVESGPLNIQYEIFFEGMESVDWVRTSGDNPAALDCANVGLFTGCSNNGGDYQAGAGSGNPAHTGTYGLVMEDWDNWNVQYATTGIWYTFDPTTACDGSACDYINISFWWTDLGQLDSNEYMEVLGNDSDVANIEIAKCIEAACPSSYTEKIVNLSAIMDDTDTEWTIRFGADMSSTADEVFWDDINITGYKIGAGGPVQEFVHVGSGWQVNVSVPNFAEGLKDLFVNATYGGNTRNDTEINSVDYGGEEGICWSYNSATQVTYIPDSCTYYTEGIGFT